MVAYTFESTPFIFKDIEARTETIVNMVYTIERASNFEMQPLQVSSTFELIEGEVAPVTIADFNNFTLRLEFNANINIAKFVLNDEVVNEMLVINRQYDYVINPAFLNEGVNQFKIITMDNDANEHIKQLELTKALTTNALNVGDVINVKGIQYTIDGINADTLTLSDPLDKDVPVHTFVECPLFTIVPYADLTFYNELPTLKAMNFVKSTYLDGMIEDTYEIDGVLGDVLHTKIELIRDDNTHNVYISNIERITMPDEV